MIIRYQKKNREILIILDIDIIKVEGISNIFLVKISSLKIHRKIRKKRLSKSVE